MRLTCSPTYWRTKQTWRPFHCCDTWRMKYLHSFVAGQDVLCSNLRQPRPLQFQHQYNSASKRLWRCSDILYLHSYKFKQEILLIIDSYCEIITGRTRQFAFEWTLTRFSKIVLLFKILTQSLSDDGFPSVKTKLDISCSFGTCKASLARQRLCPRSECLLLDATPQDKQRDNKSIKRFQFKGISFRHVYLHILKKLWN